MNSLRTYLKRSAAFSDLDFLKLWKGLFYCMWMSDRARTQQRLAIDLADLLSILSPENFVGFNAAFWRTMGREWPGIDALRMDKFLFLIRQYVNKSFEYLRGQKWEETLVERYLELLKEVPFNAKDPKIPNGLRYHVIDIYVDEVEKVDEKRKAPMEVLVKPLRALGLESKTKAVRERVKEALEDERLEEWGIEVKKKDEDEDEDEEEAEEDGWGGFDD